MPRDIYISASMIKDYLECPRKVYYRMNHPELGIQTPEMTAGIIIHYALERYWDSMGPAFEYINDQIAENNLSIDLTRRITSCMDNFFRHFSNLTSVLDHIEYRFKVPFMGAFIVGKMDRITKDGLIIDWKSSSSSKSINKDPQFILYYYVYNQIFKRDPVGVARINLSDATINMYQRNKTLEYSIINHIIPVLIDSIKGGNLPPNGVFTGKCSRCSYFTACNGDLRE